MFRVGLPCYLGLNSGRSVSMNVNKTRKHFSRNIHGAHVSPMFPSFPCETQCFSVSFCFQDINYAYATRQGSNFKKNPSMQAYAEILRALTSEHLSNFCEQFEQGQILRALSNWMGQFDTSRISLEPSTPC